MGSSEKLQRAVSANLQHTTNEEMLGAGQEADKTSALQHIDHIPSQQGAPDNFTGTVYSQRIVANEACQLLIGRVTFERGARTFWHVHSGEQVLYFLKGRGRVQVRGNQPLEAVQGNIVRVPAGAEHWHGASPDEEHAMQHLAITFGETIWLEPVSEEDYRAG